MIWLVWTLIGRNFEGSIDGENWVLLHAGTNDGHILSLQRISEQQRELELSWCRTLLIDEPDNWSTSYCDYMERHYRHTWQVNNSSEQYFRYFRIIGADPINGINRSLYVIGLEIYGHVYEH